MRISQEAICASLSMTQRASLTTKPSLREEVGIFPYLDGCPCFRTTSIAVPTSRLDHRPLSVAGRQYDRRELKIAIPSCLDIHSSQVCSKSAVHAVHFWRGSQPDHHWSRQWRGVWQLDGQRAEQPAGCWKDGKQKVCLGHFGKLGTGEVVSLSLGTSNTPLYLNSCIRRYRTFHNSYMPSC